MGALSIWHILILAGAAMLLFGGRGKISDLMGDIGKGIRGFKTGLSEPDTTEQVERSGQIPMDSVASKRPISETR